MYIWGITKKYKGLSWKENFLSGHISIGNFTIYGENAMHWAVSIRTKKYGYICFTLPIKCFGKYWGCHIYFSNDGTPGNSTYYKSIWKENNWQEEIRAKIRKEVFGHNWKKTEENKLLNYTIKNKYDCLGWCSDEDIEKTKQWLKDI